MSYEVTLCSICRYRGDRLSTLRENPDVFKLRLGILAKRLGHEQLHKELEQRFRLYFGDADSASDLFRAGT